MTYERVQKVGADGFLDIRISLGAEMAGQDVLVTICSPSFSGEPAEKAETEWHRLLLESYGSCAGLGLERPPQLELEERDRIE